MLSVFASEKERKKEQQQRSARKDPALAQLLQSSSFHLSLSLSEIIQDMLRSKEKEMQSRCSHILFLRLSTSKQISTHPSTHECLTPAQLIFQVVGHHAALHLLRPGVLVVASLVATVRNRHLLGLLAVLGML